MKLDQEKLDSSYGLLSSCNVRNITCFLTDHNVFHCLVPNLARTIAPLKPKLRAYQPHSYKELSSERFDALQKPKNKLIQPPVSVITQLQDIYSIDADFWDGQNGCVLFQKPRYGRDILIGHWSLLLTAKGCTYVSSHREHLTDIWAILLLHP